MGSLLSTPGSKQRCWSAGPCRKPRIAEKKPTLNLESGVWTCTTSGRYMRLSKAAARDVALCRGHIKGREPLRRPQSACSTNASSTARWKIHEKLHPLLSMPEDRVLTNAMQVNGLLYSQPGAHIAASGPLLSSSRLDLPTECGLDGLWWEWQWSGPAGWTSFDAGANETLEEAFTLGETTCCLEDRGTFQYFDLAAGREANGLFHIRRARMPLQADHSVSICSTFLACTHDASLSTWTDHETLGSMRSCGLVHGSTPRDSGSMCLDSAEMSARSSAWHNRSSDFDPVTGPSQI